MDALYMVPALLRELISELNDPRVKVEDKVKRELYIEDVKRRLNETYMELTQSQISDIQEYMINLVEYITNSINALGKLKIERPENPFEKIEDPEQRFIHHVFCDEQNHLGNMLEVMNIALEVVNIAIAELGDYLPVEFGESDEKKLNKYQLMLIFFFLYKYFVSAII